MKRTIVIISHFPCLSHGGLGKNFCYEEIGV